MAWIFSVRATTYRQNSLHTYCKRQNRNLQNPQILEICRCFPDDGYRKNQENRNAGNIRKRTGPGSSPSQTLNSVHAVPFLCISVYLEKERPLSVLIRLTATVRGSTPATVYQHYRTKLWPKLKLFLHFYVQQTFELL